MKHPTGERSAAFYHGFIGVYYIAGVVWHLWSAIRHWRDR
jgi:hypothetical protein